MADIEENATEQTSATTPLESDITWYLLFTNPIDETTYKRSRREFFQLSHYLPIVLAFVAFSMLHMPEFNLMRSVRTSTDIPFLVGYCTNLLTIAMLGLYGFAHVCESIFCQVRCCFVEPDSPIRKACGFIIGGHMESYILFCSSIAIGVHLLALELSGRCSDPGNFDMFRVIGISLLSFLPYYPLYPLIPPYTLYNPL